MKKLYLFFFSLTFLLAVGSCSSGVKHCEVKIVEGTVSCDQSNCDKTCYLEARKKKSSNDWKDQGGTCENDTTMEYRCMCRK